MRERPDKKAKNVMSYAWNGRMEKRLRHTEEVRESLTDWRIKFVDRAGVKIEDLLHKPNPWQGEDCGRAKCMLDMTKIKLHQGSERFKKTT